MNQGELAAFVAGALFGLSLGIWRTWAFARKLRHMGISLDEWSDYHEGHRQARGQSRRDRLLTIVRDSDR